MNGKQARGLRRIARGLCEGDWRGYYADPQWTGRRGKSDKVQPRVATVPGSKPPAPIFCVEREEFLDDRNRLVRRRVQTTKPLFLTVGHELRLLPECGRALYHQFKRNFRRLARREGGALQILAKLRESK